MLLAAPTPAPTPSFPPECVLLQQCSCNSSFCTYPSSVSVSVPVDLSRSLPTAINGDLTLTPASRVVMSPLSPITVAGTFSPGGAFVVT